ncbi:MAG: superoxide dismutase [Chitinophagaceae bacterium]
MFTFEKLPFAYDQLEPYIDGATMKVHYEKHHQTYYDNFVKAIAGTSLVDEDDIKVIFAQISNLSPVIRNNAGGYWNHSFFWQELTPQEQKLPIGQSAEAINKTFGSFDSFKEQFKQAALQRFGSGWAWLVNTQQGLLIISTQNQDNPFMDVLEIQGIPILGIDVWEHAYYLKYQNRRADYIDAFWNLVNWDFVEKKYLQASTIN